MPIQESGTEPEQIVIKNPAICLWEGYLQKILEYLNFWKIFLLYFVAGFAEFPLGVNLFPHLGVGRVP